MKTARSYITGKKGRNRVRLFEQRGVLFVEFKDRDQKRRMSLGHGDWDKGEAKAEELAVALRKEEAPAKPTEPKPLTLHALFDKYERVKTTTKSPQVQAHDRFARALFEQCWTPDVKVSDL